MIVLGHRGARGESPENTLPGFAHALAAGADGLELDVQLSSDGELVVIHDATVDRTCHGTGPVAAHSAAALAALDARRDFPAWPDKVGVPRLREVLQAFPRVRHYQIEIKDYLAEEPLELVRALARGLQEVGGDSSAGRITVTSFSARALELMRRTDPRRPLSLISSRPDRRFLRTARELGCSGVCLHLPASTAELVAEARSLGLEVTGWLGNTRQEIATLVSWGVDSVTTDLPTLVVPAVREELGPPSGPRVGR